MAKNEQITSDFVIVQQDNGQTPALPNGSVNDVNIVAVSESKVTGTTVGSVPFVGSNLKLMEDNANLFYDDTNNRLGIGTAVPNFSLDVTGTVAAGAITSQATVALTIVSGSNAAAGAGTAGTTITINPGLASAAGSGGNGGAITVTGANATGDGTVPRNGGMLQFGTNGGGVAVGGGTGSLTQVKGGNGGTNLNPATTGTGGTGGTISLIPGNAGTVPPAATVAATGGVSGGISLIIGVGGASTIAGTGTNHGGASGSLSITNAGGGAATGATSGVNTGGAAGSLVINGGVGGGASGSTTSNLAGNGSSINITAGDGGVASGTGSVGGNGGTITLISGAAGTGTTAGTVGTINFQSPFATLGFNFAPTNGVQLRFAATSDIGSVGTAYSSGAAYLVSNAYQTTPSVDNWTQGSSADKSFKFHGHPNNGFEWFTAPTSQAAAINATFWGTALMSLNAAGSLGLNASPAATQRFSISNANGAAGGTVFGGAMITSYTQSVASGNSATHIANYFSTTKAVAANSSAVLTAMTLDNSNTTIPTGVTDSGTINGLSITTVRTVGGATDNGSNTGSANGILVQTGHNGSTGSTAAVNGVRVTPNWVTGTVSGYKGLYLVSPNTGGTAPTAGNNYGVYSEDSTAYNYFAGLTGIGTTPSAGVGTLQVNSTTIAQLTVQGWFDTGANAEAGTIQLGNATRANGVGIVAYDAVSTGNLIFWNTSTATPRGFKFYTNGATVGAATTVLAVDQTGNGGIASRFAVGQSTAQSNWGLYVAGQSLTVSTQVGIGNDTTFTSATSGGEIQSFRSSPHTQAASYTVANAYHYYALDIAKGAGSAVTSQYGVFINDLTSGASNYGIASTVSSGSGKYNLYMNGTAQNYLLGNLGIANVDTANGVTGAKNLVIGDSSSTANTGITILTNGGGSPGKSTVYFSRANGATTGGAIVYDHSGTENLQFLAANVERMRVNGAGAIQVGTASASDVFHEMHNTSASKTVLLIKNDRTNTDSDSIPAFTIQKGSTTNTAGTNRFIEFDINAGGTGSGYISTNAANNAGFFASSDRRLKKDIADLEGGLTTVMAMQPRTFKWKANDEEAVGFIAQELNEVLPGQVYRSDDGTGDEMPEDVQAWSFTESGMVPYLVKAIQELKADNDAMRALLHDAGITGF